MSTIRPLDFQAMDSRTAGQILAWTFPAYRPLLEGRESVRYPDRGDRRRVQPLAFVANEGERVNGLVLGCLPAAETEMDNDPELLSLYVPPSRRRRGIGGLLLKTLECEVMNRGLQRLTAVYMTGKPEVDAFERVLAKNGWSTPEVRMRVFRSTVQQAQATPWYQRYKQDRRLEFFPWSEMRPEDIAALRVSHRETGWIAEDLLPWRYDTDRLDTASSIGVRMDGAVVGWVINHRLSADTIRFTCSFMRQDLSRRARLLPAISESLRRAGEAGYSRLMFTVPAHHVEMTRFAERWCGPWASFRGETRTSSRDLKQMVLGELP